MRKGARAQRSRPRTATLVRFTAAHQTPRVRFSILGPTLHNFPEAGFRRSSSRAVEHASQLTHCICCSDDERSRAAVSAQRIAAPHLPRALPRATQRADWPTRELAPHGCEPNSNCARSGQRRPPNSRGERGPAHGLRDARRPPEPVPRRVCDARRVSRALRARAACAQKASCRSAEEFPRSATRERTLAPAPGATGRSNGAEAHAPRQAARLHTHSARRR